MKIRIALSLLVLLASCKLKNEEIMATRWKFGEGYHMGDILDSSSISVQNDTLYLWGEKKAIVKEAKKKVDGLSELHIESLEGKQKGLYVSF